MDKEDKKRRMGQNIAFYTALAVCLIAVGVGTWQLLQPEGAAPDAQSGTAAVSSSAALPDAEASISPDAPETETASAVMGPDAPEASDAEAETPQAVSGAASVAKTDAKNADASGSKDVGNATGSKDAGNAKNATNSDAKSGASSDSKSSANSNAKSGSSSNGKSAASGGKSDAKSATSSKSSSASKSSGDAVRPVEGAVVTAYSMDKLLYNETMRDWRTHDGIDIAADAGAAVAAAKAGTVESVEADPIMGMTVTIQHQDKWETVYSSLTDAPEVEAGDEVAAGQVIGFVGETAASESALGPHLHFAVLHDGAASDPESFLA